MNKILLAALSLAAWAPVVAAPPPAVRTLAGDWRVARIDGKPVDEREGIILNASNREIWWSPRCAGFARSYRIHGTRFSTGPYLGWRARRPGDPPPLICLIAPPRQTADVFAVLAAATSIRRTADKGIEISGHGRSLLLFTP